MTALLAAWRWLRLVRAERRFDRLLDRVSSEVMQQRTREMRELTAAARTGEGSGA